MPHLERDGTRIWYELVGSGSPLMIVQGIGYPSDASWRLIPKLDSKHRVLSFDNRGVGRSDVPVVPFSIEDMADDAAAVIAAAGYASVHVLGLSMGGLIAQELALRQPDLVRTLILGCTSPGGREAVPFTPQVAELFVRLGGLPARQAAEEARELVYSNATPESEVMADIDARMQRPTSREGYMGQLIAVNTYRGSFSRLPQLRKPTLILHGSADLLVPPANANLLQSAIKGSELRIFDGAGHIFTTDALGATIGAITQFLAEHK